MTLKERLMSFIGRKPLYDEKAQQEREARTESARIRAIATRVRAEKAAADTDRSTDRVTQLRVSFERANRRLGK